MFDIDELMQLTVDGTATPEQEAELRAALGSSPEAGDRFAALEALTRELNAVPLVDPPGVKPAVMAAIRPARRISSRATRPWFAFSYAAAAVLVIGIAIRYAVVSAPNSSGSMMPIPVEGQVVSRVASPAASMTVRREGDVFVVDVTGARADSLEVDASRLERIGDGRFRRLPNAKGLTVIKLRLPDNKELQATIDLE